MSGTGFDLIVIGGGAAGLAGALTLARARRSVLLIDAGDPRNAPAAGVHGFLTRDGMSPAEFVAAGAAEVTRYGGTILHANAVAARRTGPVFTVTTTVAGDFTARRLLLATGLVDDLPDVPGLRERWGRDVLHCPYCHGWEVRDQRIVVLAAGPKAVHQALLFRQWSPDVTLIRHTGPGLDDEQREQLAARGIALVEGRVTGLEITDDRIVGVRLASGGVVPCRALAVQPRFAARVDLAAGLGLSDAEHPLGIGTHIAADSTGRTAVPGLWVAGNVTDLTAQVLIAAAAGITAATAINADLVADDTRLAVKRHRAPSAVERGFSGPSADRAAAALVGCSAGITDDVVVLLTRWRYSSTSSVLRTPPSPWTASNPRPYGGPAPRS
jgi:thioredoxin reductase